MSSPKEDLKTLGLKQSATAAEIKARYRELALEHHPDRGGDKETFQRICEAYERVKDRKCLRCKGARKVERQRGLKLVKVWCPDCTPKGA